VIFSGLSGPRKGKPQGNLKKFDVVGLFVEEFGGWGYVWRVLGE